MTQNTKTQDAVITDTPSCPLCEVDLAECDSVFDLLIQALGAWESADDTYGHDVPAWLTEAIEAHDPVRGNFAQRVIRTLGLAD